MKPNTAQEAFDQALEAYNAEELEAWHEYVERVASAPQRLPGTPDPRNAFRYAWDAARAGVAASPSHATVIENRQAGVESGTLVASPSDADVLRRAAEIVDLDQTSLTQHGRFEDLDARLRLLVLVARLAARGTTHG